MTTIHEEVAAARAAAAEQWGGADHDDTRETGQWLDYIFAQLGKSNFDVLSYAAQQMQSQPNIGPTDADNIAMDKLVRARLVKIAALAMDAIASIDRRHAKTVN